jgi:hypothetical protein
MIGAILLTSYLASQAAPVQVPPFQPRPHVTFQLPPPNARLAQRPLERREIVCGMVVVHKSPDDDPRMLLPARKTGAVIRRIEPQVCSAPRAVPAK